MARNRESIKARTLPANDHPAAGRVAATFIPGVALDARSRVPLQRQLYAALRDAILDVRIPPGARLPSTRLFAESLELSRTTVSLAYEQLRAEGYLSGRERSGTFVARLIPDDALHASRTPRVARSRPLRARAGARSPNETVRPEPLRVEPSARGRTISTLLVSSTTTPGGSTPICFRMGTPALDRFPFALWGKLLARRWRSLSPSQLAYGDPVGLPSLRESIAAYARQARAVNCDASQVIVVSGAQQAFDLVARVLLDPGDVAAVEDPGYRGIRGAFAAAGSVLAPIAVDREGLDVAALRAIAPHARVVCVTPSHQFPLGVTMSAPRRLALLEWARRAGGWIVEDDFDSEYRFRGRPLPSLQGMDDAARVLYVGTFSKTLFPALRLGYLIVPSQLVDVFSRARRRRSSSVDARTNSAGRVYRRRTLCAPCTPNARALR